MYFEFLLRRAHSRKRVDRKYWSGESLYSRTTCSNSVIVGVMGPIGSGLPQFGFPRRFAMNNCLSTRGNYELQNPCLTIRFFGAAGGFLEKHIVQTQMSAIHLKAHKHQSGARYVSGNLFRKSIDFCVLIAPSSLQVIAPKRFRRDWF